MSHTLSLIGKQKHTSAFKMNIIFNSSLKNKSKMQKAPLRKF